MQADGPAPKGTQLGVAAGVGGGEGGDVDGVADGLVTRGVDHIAQGLLGILNAAPLRVPIPEEHQLLLLPGPEASHALPVYLGRWGNGISLKGTDSNNQGPSVYGGNPHHKPNC